MKRVADYGSVGEGSAPGDTAKKSILTLWHDEGRSGLQHP